MIIGMNEDQIPVKDERVLKEEIMVRKLQEQ